MKNVLMALVVIVALGGAAVATLGAADSEVKQQDCSTSPDSLVVSPMKLANINTEAGVALYDSVFAAPEVAYAIPDYPSARDYTNSLDSGCAGKCHLAFAEDLSRSTSTAEPLPGPAHDVLTHPPNSEVVARAPIVAFPLLC